MQELLDKLVALAIKAVDDDVSPKTIKTLVDSVVGLKLAIDGNSYISSEL